VRDTAEIRVYLECGHYHAIVGRDLVFGHPVADMTDPGLLPEWQQAVLAFNFTDGTKVASTPSSLCSYGPLCAGSAATIATFAGNGFPGIQPMAARLLRCAESSPSMSAADGIRGNISSRISSTSHPESGSQGQHHNVAGKAPAGFPATAAGDAASLNRAIGLRWNQPGTLHRRCGDRADPQGRPQWQYIDVREQGSLVLRDGGPPSSWRLIIPFAALPMPRAICTSADQTTIGLGKVDATGRVDSSRERNGGISGDGGKATRPREQSRVAVDLAGNLFSTIC